MKIELSPTEARVIGCFIEKELTTPDQYPLSLNALTNACNQKTNRDPVMELDEAAVQSTIDSLQKKHLVFDRSGFGSRVTKYQHRFCGTDFSELKLTPQERGVVCVLLLRGAQTAGELRTRTNRLCEFTDSDAVDRVLEALIGRDSGPLVARLARSPGERESRYMHLFSGAIESAPASPRDAPVPSVASDPSLAQRVEQLERDIAALRAELEDLRSR